MSEDKHKQWHLVAVLVARDGEELVSSMLFDLGASGIVTLEEDDARVKLGAYFDGQIIIEEIKRAIEMGLARAGSLSDLLGISFSSIPDQDWMQKWKEGFEPALVGERLIIAPSWKLPDQTEGREVVQIDPGMAFGTGTHETTRMCLEAIERYWRGGRLLDAGTGTGILAIAAAKLWPGSTVTAVDIDPQAVEVARQNIAINGVSNSIEVLEGEPRDFSGNAFDVVVANLTAEVIISLMDDLSGCMAPSGSLILSGILTELRPGVEQRTMEAGLAIIERREAEEWSALVARRGDR